MEALAYRIKQTSPALFRLLELVARGVTALRFGRAMRCARAMGTLKGSVAGHSAVIRPVTEADTEQLAVFLNSMPEERLIWFRPHGFDDQELRQVLCSRAFLTYSLFVEDELTAYALLKVSPSGSAFIGLLVGSRWEGLGIGRFLVGYLYWQASLAGLQARSTISRHNTASLRSHQAVSEYEVVAELPNDYLMIEFPAKARTAPALEL